MHNLKSPWQNLIALFIAYAISLCATLLLANTLISDTGITKVDLVIIAIAVSASKDLVLAVVNGPLATWRSKRWAVKELARVNEALGKSEFAAVDWRILENAVHVCCPSEEPDTVVLRLRAEIQKRLLQNVLPETLLPPDDVIVIRASLASILTRKGECT